MPGPHIHDGLRRHRSVDATGVAITAGKPVITDGIGGFVYGAVGGGTSMWFNVQDYGAVPGTDCTVAIQAADTAAAAVNGTVYFPASDDSYLVSFDSRIYCVKPSSNVTWRGDGMFSSILELDPASTVPTRAFGGIAIIAIGTPSAGVDQVNIFDLGILPHWTTKGSALRYLCGIYAVEQESNFTEHSDDITIERVRVLDSYIGIGCTKSATEDDATYTADRHQRWAIRGCLIDTTENKAFDLQMFEDSEVVNNAIVNAQDGIQLEHYAARIRVIGNSVQYKDGGINLTEGVEDIEVGDNIFTAIAGGGIGLTGGLVIRRESHASTGPTSSRVNVHDNIFDDTANAASDSIGVRFVTWSANTGVAVFEDYEFANNLFIADVNYLYDEQFPAKSSAVRLRVFDNYFSDEVITDADWVSDRTRFERNHVTAAFTASTDDWDYRGNVWEGGFTNSATGTTLDDGYVRNVLVSGTAPSAGQTLVASSATAAAWGSGSGIGEILIADSHSTPLVFADLLQNEAGDDLLYDEP